MEPTMKTRILALFAATALAVVTPAFAQDLNRQQSGIEATIETNARSGSLTNAEAAQLRTEYKGISQLEARYRSSQRSLSSNERRDLNNRLDVLAQRVQYLSNNDAREGENSGGQNINERQVGLDARIDAGVKSGALTVEEARQLRIEFDAIAREEAQYRASGRGLTQAERMELDRRFDVLSSRIKDERNDGQTAGQAVNERQARLSTRIDMGVRNRTLTNAEAARLRSEAQAIARQEAQYRASGQGVSRAERTELDRRFDALDSRISLARRNDDRRWTNLNQRQAQFSQRLDDAVNERRLTSREAANLRVEFDGIARLESQYRRSRPGLTANERKDLNARFTRMEANFRASASRPGDNQPDLFDLLFGLLN